MTARDSNSSLPCRVRSAFEKRRQRSQAMAVSWPRWSMREAEIAQGRHIVIEMLPRLSHKSRFDAFLRDCVQASTLGAGLRRRGSGASAALGFFYSFALRQVGVELRQLLGIGDDPRVRKKFLPQRLSQP
jgi:hypothetical protein